MFRGRRIARWRIAACAALATASLLLAACAGGGSAHVGGDIHDRLHEIAHEACDRIEGGEDAFEVIADATAEGARHGATEAETREILEEECGDLIE